MNREQGDIGDSFDSSIPKFPEPKFPEPKSPEPKTQSDDASAVADRIATPAPQRKRLSPAQEESDLSRTILYWCCEQFNRAQPWNVCLDPGKVSLPRSFKEFVDRLPSNLDTFRGNYFVLLVAVLALNVTAEVTLVLAVAAVVLFCAALKLHEEGDHATIWGTETAMLGRKNHRLLLAVAVALPLMYVVDMWTAVTWSFGATAAIGFVHASLHAGPGAAADLAKKLEPIPEEGDVPSQ